MIFSPKNSQAVFVRVIVDARNIDPLDRKIDVSPAFAPGLERYHSVWRYRKRFPLGIASSCPFVKAKWFQACCIKLGLMTADRLICIVRSVSIRMLIGSPVAHEDKISTPAQKTPSASCPKIAADIPESRKSSCTLRQSPLSRLR